MASRSKVSKALNRLSREVPTEEEMILTILSYNDSRTPEHADRASAIIGAALLEHALQQTILSRFTPLEPKDRDALFDGARNGPLSSFASKIVIAFSLGIYGPNTKTELGHIRQIRNAFAHTMKRITFDTKEVRDACELLTFHTGKNIMADILRSDEPLNAKQKYASSLGFLSGTLRGRIQTMGQLALYSTRMNWGPLD